MALYIFLSQTIPRVSYKPYESGEWWGGPRKLASLFTEQNFISEEINLFDNYQEAGNRIFLVGWVHHHDPRIKTCV